MRRSHCLIACVGFLALGCGTEPPAPQPQPPAGGPSGPEVAPTPRPSGLNLNPFQVLGALDEAKRDAAQAQCRAIEQAIQAYMLKNPDGQAPESLDVLVKGDAARGLQPLIDGGLSAITDPWGKPFTFEMVPDGEFSRPRVSTTAPDGKPIYSRVWESKLKAKK